MGWDEMSKLQWAVERAADVEKLKGERQPGTLEKAQADS
jgi:hypothetical protein